MTHRDMALHYLRYYEGLGQAAVNAPEELRRFLRAQPHDQISLHNALRTIAGLPTYDATQSPGLWLVSAPGASKHCDAVLRSRKAPASWDELLTRAYAQAQLEIVDVVRSFIRERIQAF